jgi:L-fuculose-phosphate aldolase
MMILWITPSAVDKGNLRPRDIMCIKSNGEILGPHQPSTEHPFHQAIYSRRPDLRALVHSHSPALVAFSIVRRIPGTRIMPQAHDVCGTAGYVTYALPGSWALGEQIAATFANALRSSCSRITAL